MTHFSTSLPPEMLVQIFSYLDSPKELISCCKVSKAWQSAALDNTLWQPFYPSLNSSKISIPHHVNLWKAESEREVITRIYTLAKTTDKLSSCELEFFTLDQPSTISIKIGPMTKKGAFPASRKVEIVWNYTNSNSDKKIVPPLYCPYMLKLGTTKCWIEYGDDKLSLVKEIKSFADKQAGDIVVRTLGIAALVMSAYLAFTSLRY